MRKLVLVFVLSLLSRNIFADGQPSVMMPPQSLVISVIQNQFMFNVTNVQSASIINNNEGKYVGMQLVIKPEFAEVFSDMIANGMGKTMNVAYNNQIVTATVIQAPLGASLLITGMPKTDALFFINALHKTNSQTNNQVSNQPAAGILN